MKVKIEYKFKLGNHYPYVAYTYIEDNYHNKVSNISFEDAKEQLIQEIKKIDFTPKTLPEPEEVEI